MSITVNIEVDMTTHKNKHMESTGPALLKANCQKWGDRVWMRKKEFGFWTEYTWNAGYETIKRFSLGLISLGFERGDNISILGDNDPHWFWAELGAQCAGGAIAGVFSDSPPEEVKHIILDSESRFVVAQDQEQVDKVVQIKSELPLVERVIYWDPDGMRKYDDPILISFGDVLDMGQAYEIAHPGIFEANIDEVDGDGLSLLMYTSGTTGLPKGAMINWGRVIASSGAMFRVNPIHEKDEFVSFTLPGWMAEQSYGITASLITGQKLNFPEKQETVAENIREIGPQMIFYPSRLWETMVSTIQQKIAETNALNRLIYRVCMPIGYRVADKKFRGERIGFFLKALYGICELVVFRPLRDRHGLSRLRIGFTAGAVLGPDTFRMLTAIGIDLRQIYGSTESLGGTMHFPGDIKYDSVGQPTPGKIVRIADDGEILMDKETSFMGYYGRPEATEKAFSGGWYRTGDAGHLDADGHLYYLDRVEFMRELADGTKFAPQYIESRLKFSQYIKDAFVVGDGRKNFIGAIINIDFDNVGNWAEKKRVPYTTFVALSQKAEVCELVCNEIAQVNSRLPKRFRIGRFVNLIKEFDPDEAELTRTRKLRRTHIEEKYKEMIEALYGERTQLVVEAPVVYRDGRKGVMKTEIRVNVVPDEGGNHGSS